MSILLILILATVAIGVCYLLFKIGKFLFRGVTSSEIIVIIVFIIIDVISNLFILFG